MTENYDIVIAGMGGQGSILASYLLAEAAVLDNVPVLSTGDYGMAQRGGMVLTHLRLGKDANSQRIPLGSADLLLGCEPSEALRNIGAVHENAAVIIDTLVHVPVPVHIDSDLKYPDIEEIIQRFSGNFKRVYPINASKIASDFGNIRIMNTVLIGAIFALGELPVSRSGLVEVLKKQMRPELAELNIKAFEAGENEFKKLL